MKKLIYRLALALALVLPGLAPAQIVNPAFVNTGAGAVARTYLARGQETKSIKDYGALGDGVADDTAALLKAMNALPAAEGGVVFFPDGSYNITSTVIPHVTNITLRGESAQGARIYYQGASGSLFTIDHNLDYFRLENIELIAPAHTDANGWALDLTGGPMAAGTVISGITNANPGVVTTAAANGLVEGDAVYISGVAGMTQVNNHYYTVHLPAANSFSLIDPNTGNVDTSAYGAWASGGTVQKLTDYYRVRDFYADNFYIQGFVNGVRIGAGQNVRISRGRIAKTQAAGVGLQFGDSGNVCTTTALSQVFVSGFNDANVWNKNCAGLVLDNVIVESATNGLRSDKFTTGTLYSELVTNSVTGTDPVQLTAVNDVGAWGTIGTASGTWASAAKQISTVRANRQWFTRAHRSSNLTETSDSTMRELVFDAADMNSNVDYNAATGYYTVVIPGIYRVFAHVVMATITSGNTESIGVQMGGVWRAITDRIATASESSPTFILQVEATAFLTAGQTIFVSHKGNSSSQIYGDVNGLYTYVTIERLN